MARDRDVYVSPLVERNASREMSELFGAQKKFSTWRRLWLELAREQKKLGLDIKQTQIAQMAQHLDDINYKKAAGYEKKFRHDVMAHVYAFGDVAPKAAPIIHLGATSCFVGDNADLIIMREALILVAGKLAAVIDLLGKFAKRHKSLVTLGFTHYQPAQLTTVGKRATLWCYEFALDLQEIEKICAMKIDVEGFELEVLQGIKNTLVKYRPFVFCEIWHLPEKFDPAYDEKRRRGESICKLLNDIDYDIIGFVKKDNELVDIKAAEDFNDNQRSDYVLLHNSERENFVHSITGQS